MVSGSCEMQVLIPEMRHAEVAHVHSGVVRESRIVEPGVRMDSRTKPAMKRGSSVHGRGAGMRECGTGVDARRTGVNSRTARMQRRGA